MEKFLRVFEEFKKLHTPQPKQRKTFMDISGYPHYENVVSNILAFFMDDSEEHGFGNLMLRALLACAGDFLETHGSTVEREVYTLQGNRIDLLITTEDYVICIENKIYADLTNDLQDYHETTAKRIGGTGKTQINILLSLNAIQPDAGFINITYARYWEAVKANLGFYTEQCDNTWLLYLKDFMRTIESLQGGTAVSKEFESFYATHFETIKEWEEEKKRRLVRIMPKRRRHVRSDYNPLFLSPTFISQVRRAAAMTRTHFLFFPFCTIKEKRKKKVWDILRLF